MAVLNTGGGGGVRASFPATESLRSLAVSTDGRWTAGGNWRSTPAVEVWDNATGRVVHAIVGGPEGATSANAAFSPDGRWLVTCEQGAYRFWETGTWAPGLRIERDQVEPLPGPIAWSRDGRTIAVASSTATVLLIDAATSERLGSLKANAFKNICSLDFRPDGRSLAVAGMNQQVRVWDLRLVRRALADIGLDWPDGPPPPSEPGAALPTKEP